MSQKLVLAVSTAALMSISMYSATALAKGIKANKYPNAVYQRSKATSVNKQTGGKKVAPKLIDEKDLENKPYIYIVQLEDDAVASYDGGLAGLAATNPQAELMKLNATRFEDSKHHVKLDVNAPKVRAYRNHLEAAQTEFMQRASSLSSSISAVQSYKFALNGLAVEATPTEAARLARLPGVKAIQRDKIYQFDTDVGPTQIGAPNVWNGSVIANTGGLKGEGIVIGILDSGVNTDHPSFADIAGDGYDHDNPRGKGVYLGECINAPERCNDKLIGIYSYPAIYRVYSDTDVFPAGLIRGEDYNGHGSHVASTAGGNLLLNVNDRIPEPDVIVGDGIETEYQFDELSGVAPRANIISYQVCQPGNEGFDGDDRYDGCPGSAIISGIEDAIKDQVDVLNMSISGGNNPWQNNTELAFLAARNAGVFVAVSAGNSGPNAESSVKHAPWYTSVAASKHGRTISYTKEIGSFTGGDNNLPDMEGKNISRGISAPIVYAGNYANANDPTGEPRQCLEPFPKGTFNGEIVVCDRGIIARVAKAENVAAGGAGGLVLVNLNEEDARTSVDSDVFVIPGIHINADNGDALKAWLASGTGHMATISAPIGSVDIDSQQVDSIARFSSRGPNSSISTLAPTMAAPGVDIMAAYTDEDYGKDVTQPAASDFNRISGTSMASPHVAGAGALVASVQPTWTPDNIRSALAMTATTAMKKEDTTTDADWFDMGSGRINVDLAVQSGLVMDEVDIAYRNADPDIGGEPRRLNLPSITDNNCVGICSWTRIVTATKAGSWTVSGATISPGLSITASPASFELEAGESQEITVTIDAFDTESNTWSFGMVTLQSPSSPDLHWPVSVIPTMSFLPELVSLQASRNQDSYLLGDLLAVEITDFQIEASMVKGTVEQGEIPQDSSSNSVFDDINDGTAIFEVNVPTGALRLVAEIIDSTSPDMDLYVVYDANGNGVATESEIVAESTTPSSTERVNISSPDNGLYWIVVHNWQASAENASDTFTLSHATLTPDSNEILSVVADAAIPRLTPFSVRFGWDLGDAAKNDMFYGVATFGMDADHADNLGTIELDIQRTADDISIITEQRDRVNPGDVIDYAVAVNANFTPEDRAYEISVAIPDNLNLVVGSLGDNATFDSTTNTINWTLVQNSLADITPTYRITDNTTDENCRNPEFTDDQGSPLNQGGSYFDLAAHLGGYDPDLNGDSITASFDASYTFLQDSYSSYTVTDDGFISVTGDVGLVPYINQPVPFNRFGVDGVIAPFWRDSTLDPSNNAGVNTTHTDDWIVVDYQNIKPFAATLSGSTDIADFQAVFTRHPVSEGPSIIFSYRNMVHGASQNTGLTIGYESADGFSGGMSHYRQFSSEYGPDQGGVPSNVISGLQICLYQEPVSAPTLLPFSLEVASNNPGGALQVIALSALTNNDFTTTVAIQADTNVQVEGPPAVTIDGATAANLSVRELSTLTLQGEVFEPNNDDYTVTWRQLSGPDVVLTQDGSNEVSISTPAVTADSIAVFEMKATDANNNEGTATAEVTIRKNAAPTLSITKPSSVTEGADITIRANGSDADGDQLSYTINGVPGNVFTTAAPNTGSERNVTFTITVTDGLDTTTETAVVTVTPQSSGGALGWIALLLIPMIYLRKDTKNPLTS